MKKPKLVICDIDETLVVKHKLLTPKARAIIEELHQYGVYFGIASGRPRYQIEESYSEWDYYDIDVMIGLNGSLLWDNIEKKQHDYFIMKKEWIKETIDLMSKFDTNPSVYREDSQLFLHEDETYWRYKTYTTMKTEIANSIEDLYSQDTAKIMFKVAEEKMPEVEQWVKEHPSTNFIGYKSGSELMEFCDKRIHKGYALEKFCEIHHIDLEDVVAFGDTSNDNAMLEIAGLGVCMLNGSDDTKAVADMITEKPCDEDGWADFMERHIMPLVRGE